MPSDPNSDPNGPAGATQPVVFDRATAEQVLDATRYVNLNRASNQGGGAVAPLPPAAVLRPCITQWSGSGSSGNATTTCSYTYNIAAPSDAGFSNCWNGTNALTPMNSRPRALGMVTVYRPPDGSPGTAYRGPGGAWVLWDVMETCGTKVCGT